MRWIVARIAPPPARVGAADLAAVLDGLAIVQHSLVRQYSREWLVGAFVVDDGGPHARPGERIVCRALARVVDPACRVETTSELVGGRGGGGLMRPPPPPDQAR